MSTTDRRLELHEVLKGIAGAGGNVYFQPPSGYQMNYPCIVYQLDNMLNEHADNQPYRNVRRYLVTSVDRDPDSALPEKISKLPTCSFNRAYSASNLNHVAFTLYF